jgi:hypothetical protein
MSDGKVNDGAVMREFVALATDGAVEAWRQGGPAGLASVTVMAKAYLGGVDAPTLREAVGRCMAEMSGEQVKAYRVAVKAFRDEAAAFAEEGMAAFVERSRTLPTVASGARTGKTATSDAEAR